MKATLNADPGNPGTALNTQANALNKAAPILTASPGFHDFANDCGL